MATLPVYNQSGKKVGKYEIDPAELAPRINRQLLHDAVVMYQANQRMGSRKTKTRGEAAGSTKKMYRQKGTGNARAGSRRSGIRRGGGHIHALRPKNFHYRLPRKALQLATRMALAAKIQDDQVVVIDKLVFDEPKTREMAALLKAADCGETTVLIATADFDQNVYRSARNIHGADVAPATQLNALALLKPRRLVFTKDALDGLRERFQGQKDTAKNK